MIAIKTKIEEKGATPRNLAKHFKQANLAAAKTLGEHFHEVNLPRRFTKAGAVMLGYAVRAKSYVRLKREKFGTEDPIVKTGYTKNMVLSMQDVRVSGTSNSWKTSVVLHARHINRFKTKRIRVGEELRKVATREFGPLARVFEKAFDQQLEESQFPSTS